MKLRPQAQGRFSRYSAERHPTMAALLHAGLIFYDGPVIVGRADDGIEVSLGHEDRADSIEAYLTTHPSPKDW